MSKVESSEIGFISDEQIAKLEKAQKLLSEILDMKEKIMSCFGNESAEKAIQGTIDFKTKSGIHYITYKMGDDKVLTLINTEDNSTISFVVEKVIEGVNSENFHPKKMFVGRPVKAQ